MYLQDFPKVYNTQREEIMNQQLFDAQSRSTSRKNNINGMHPSVPKGDAAFNWGNVIGLIVGVISCTGMGMAENNDTNFSIFIFFVIWMFSAFVGKLIDKSEEKSYEEIEEDIASRLRKEDADLVQELQNIRINAENDKKEYLSQFENKTQEMSVRFAESELAKEVIEWMTKGFCKIIDSADRRSHIQQIEVPFIFNVYVDKIVCNLGTFDFELKRCRNLDSPLEQTALARAIASAIQLNVKMKYPKDVSGTDMTIKILYAYTAQYVSITITYVAPNGNFRIVKEW